MGGATGDSGSAEGRIDTKAELREEIWNRLEAEGVARFPGARGRIPNFRGAEDAADRLRKTEIWARAKTVKANPDSPQWPVRQRALEDGKLVYMAVPRLAEENPFFLLDPEHLSDPPRRASSIKGASRSARTVPLEEMAAVELVVAGSVAVSADGARLGKGGGYSDLEYALALEAGLLDEGTPVATTVHELQVLDPGGIPVEPHDVRLDLIVTPERVIRCQSGKTEAAGLRWELLSREKIEAIPLLRRLHRERGADEEVDHGEAGT